MSTIYFIQAGSDGPIKIGFASDFRKRICVLQTASHEKLNILATRSGTVRDEKALHKILKPYNVRGEWFYPCPEVLSEVKKSEKFSTKKVKKVEEDMAEPRKTIQSVMTAAQSYVNDGRSQTALARASGLHRNTIRAIGQPGWLPTLRTVHKLSDGLDRIERERQ